MIISVLLNKYLNPLPAVISSRSLYILLASARAYQRYSAHDAVHPQTADNCD
jgi:hypothetical protein